MSRGGFDDTLLRVLDEAPVAAARTSAGLQVPVGA